MQTKLTLRLDSDLIENTKKIAAARHTSLSLMVAEYFRSLQNNYQVDNSIESPVLKELSGILPKTQTQHELTMSYAKRLKEKFL
jgi:hypothetical protein